ncbi:dTDP-4-dehydrorhamnose 3,5-epimerase [Pyruvatibacter sp.]|uniref:dTDP-4-dehydrorhamnose 3,5-epimerase n=1 Tax=Pyruvatibacter sp. TaxID=1981328 RepID=UPI0032EC27E8
MKLTQTNVEGVIRIDISRMEDERGYFARSFCVRELKEAGIEFDISQANVSYNAHAGTLRGLHYQDQPTPDPKIVRCEQGAIFDVALDLRPHSLTFGQWTGMELTSDSATALLVPAGCAHGFLSLTDDSRVLYLMGAPYVPELSRGVRWNDPSFDIAWPGEPKIIAPRDANYPDFELNR